MLGFGPPGFAPLGSADAIPAGLVGIQLYSTLDAPVFSAELDYTLPATAPGALVVTTSIAIGGTVDLSESTTGRVVSDATSLAAGNSISSPCYLVQVEWPDFSTQICSYGPVIWDGNGWAGAGIQVSFAPNGRPSVLTLNDASGAYRTLVQTYGIRDRRITVWHAYINALAVADPVLMPHAFGDRCDIASGVVTIQLGASSSARSTTPRQRIGQAIGVNYLAPDGYTFLWGGQTVTLKAQ